MGNIIHSGNTLHILGEIAFASHLSNALQKYITHIIQYDARDIITHKTFFNYQCTEKE